MFDAIAIMMIVILPVFILAALFVWRYRASNTSARYTPNLAYYWPVEILVWGVPAAIIVWLGFHLWHDTYKLDPYANIDPGVQPLQVDVVAQDWKWLFIYPEQGIAVVNELAFPSGRPLSLKITSDTVMNSFVIPALGGQIYAMAGMQTRLHLLADKPGRFWGRNVQYSGSGFADQQFDAVAMSERGFRRVGGEGEAVFTAARRLRLRAAGQAERRRSRDLLLRRRAGSVRQDHRQICPRHRSCRGCRGRSR